MPYLLGLRGEIQPACYIYPEGIPPTMSQSSFSVVNVSLRKKKSSLHRTERSPMCPVCIPRTTRKGAPQKQHDFSTVQERTYRKLNQNGPTTKTFSLRKRQVLQPTRCSTVTEAHGAILRRADGLVKPENTSCVCQSLSNTLILLT